MQQFLCCAVFCHFRFQTCILLVEKLFREKKMKEGLKYLFPILAAVAVVALGILLYNGVIHFNNPSLREYPVQGVDVSAYQGTIDWNVLAD